PKRYWGDAVLTSAYLINRMPSRSLRGKTPQSLLQPTQVSYSLPPRVFRCVCFIHNHSPNLKKLDPHAIKGIFLGYSATQKGYKCQDPSSGRVYVTRDVSFLENQFYFGTSIQGENSGRELNSQSEDIQFFDFLDYKKGGSCAMDTEIARCEGVTGQDNEVPKNSRMFGQVYSRQKTDPNPLDAPSLDDPSVMKSHKW
ncbi:hypothetical protein QML37_30830, partial [Klebsiella pneumoniae]|uniref:hypothetical protein n=1 Tax=Klebsiella pneumoniae TaxID=573 RepID=UPI003A804CCB